MEGMGFGLSTYCHNSLDRVVHEQKPEGTSGVTKDSSCSGSILGVAEGLGKFKRSIPSTTTPGTLSPPRAQTKMTLAVKGNTAIATVTPLALLSFTDSHVLGRQY